jgi:FLYWCH zinc finger domain
MATEITKTSSNKGGECVIVNGYKFCKGCLKQNNSKIVWRCSIRNCPAVLVTSIDTTTVVSSTSSHSHPPVTGLAEMQTARVSCKRKAMNGVGCRPAKVTRACLAQVATDSMFRSDVKKLTRSVQDVRRKNILRLRQILLNCILQLTYLTVLLLEMNCLSCSMTSHGILLFLRVTRACKYYVDLMQKLLPTERLNFALIYMNNCT